MSLRANLKLWIGRRSLVWRAELAASDGGGQRAWRLVLKRAAGEAKARLLRFLQEQRVLLSATLPPTLFVAALFVGIPGWESELERREFLGSLVAFSVGLAALVVPLLVLVAESSARREDDVPATVTWGYTGLRSALVVVYWTLLLTLLAFALTFMPGVGRASIAGAALMVALLSVLWLAAGTYRVIRLTHSNVARELWVDRMLRATTESVERAFRYEAADRFLQRTLAEVGYRRARDDYHAISPDHAILRPALVEGPGFHYLLDLDVEGLRSLVRSLGLDVLGTPFQQLRLNLKCGRAIFPGSVSLAYRQDAARHAADFGRRIPRLLRVGDRPDAGLAGDIDELISRVSAALKGSDEVRATALLEQFRDIVIGAERSVREIRARNATHRVVPNLDLLNWIAAALGEFSRATRSQLPREVVTQSVGLWRAGWSLAITLNSGEGRVVMARASRSVYWMMKGGRP